MYENFFGNNKSDYIAHVKELLSAYKVMRCNMCRKVHNLHSQLDFFPKNLEAFSNEYGERFYQEIAKFGKRFSRKWNVLIERVD